MRIGAHIPCYKLTHFLPAVLTSLSWVDRIVVTNSHRPWDGEGGTDNTQEICYDSGLSNIDLVRGDWSQDSEHFQRNLALNIMSDMDYVLVVDSDEIILLEEQKDLLAFADSHKEYDAFAVGINTYFGDLSHVSIYDKGHTPIALVRPNCRFFITRCVTTPWTVCAGVTMHHLKFLQPKKDIEWRMGAKDISQQRRFIGSAPVDENKKLVQFMSQCGFEDIKGEITTKEVLTA